MEIDYLRQVERAHELPTGTRQAGRRGTEVDVWYVDTASWWSGLPTPCEHCREIPRATARAIRFEYGHQLHSHWADPFALGQAEC